MAKIVGVCISDRKGVPKKNVGSAYLEIAKGLENDAHSGFGHRQVSLLAKESIDKMRQKIINDHKGRWLPNSPLLRGVRGVLGRQRGSSSLTDVELREGSFAENLTTEGIDLKSLLIGTEMKIGETVRLRITQIGKDCHAKGDPARPDGRSGGCAIFRKIGDCIMPVEGIFAEVLQSGDVKIGDKIEISKI